MFLGVLIGEGVKRQHGYTKGRTTWYILVKGGTRQEVDSQFMALKRRVKKPSRKDRTTSAPWISDTTWKLSDQRTALESKCRSNQGEHRVLTQSIQAALKEDRRFRVRKEGEEIEALVLNDQVREAWSKTQW